VKSGEINKLFNTKNMSEIKGKHAMVLNMISEVAANYNQARIVHTDTEDYKLDGRHLKISGKNLLYFGSCGYSVWNSMPA